MSEIVLEKNDVLPLGWLRCKLSELTIKITDGEHQRPRFVEKGVPFVSAKDVGENGVVFDNVKYVTSNDAMQFRKKCDPKKNDLLIVSRGNVGGACIIDNDKPFCLLGSVILIRNHLEIDSKYLNYYLKQSSVKEKLVRLSGSTVQGAIYLRDVKNLDVLLCPLNEQKRIVAKIDELFSELEYSIENLQKTRLQLKEYKQSILKNAFNGTLTTDWREKHGSKLEKVTEILKKIIESKHGFDDNYLNPLSQGIGTLPKLPPQWIWTMLGILSESMKNGIYKPKSSYSNNGIACLRMYNIEDGELAWKDIKRMNLSQKEISEYELLPNDLLVNRVNSRELVGKTARIPEGIERCVYESKNIRLRLYRDYTNSTLVAYWFHLFRQTFFNRNAQQTVGMASINQEQLSQMPIPYMHISEQNELIKQIEFHFTIVKNLLSIINVNLKYLDKLRNSVLKTAFEGKLVTQDPNDESAEILLQKIKQEKERFQETQKVIKAKTIKTRRMKNAK